VISVVIAAIGFAIITAAIFYSTELARSRDKTKVMVNQLLDTVEYSSAIAAYTNNEQIAKDVIQGLLRNDIVQEVNIISDQGFHLENSKEPIAKNSQKINRTLVSPFDSKQAIGSITVIPRGDYNLVEATHSALLSAINSFLLITLTTVIILWVFRHNILQPLTVVSDTLHDISAGEKQRIAPLSKHQNDELGRLIADINGLLDVLETKFNNERSLRERIEQIEKQLRNIFESTSAGLFQIDHQGKILTYNPTFLKFLVNDELSSDGLTGHDFGETFVEDPKLFKEMVHAATSSKSLVSNDLALRIGNDNGGQRWMHCLLSRIDEPNGQVLFEGVIFDISTRIAKENAIRHQAEYDALTGVLRRDSIERNLAEFLEDTRQWPIVLMLLDLDGFKAVNDNYGHDAGDEVLVEVTQRFKNNIRSSDVVGRLGGDEFVIILNKCEPINAELTIAKKIIQAIQEPIVLKSKQTVNIGVSIGMASNTIPGSTVETLMKAADNAMYMVKRQGKNSFAVNKGEGLITVELTQA
jgi:diguanylate cyclase (GGDEF)-like protein/PAS domain S-box-containing protein